MAKILRVSLESRRGEKKRPRRADQTWRSDVPTRNRARMAQRRAAPRHPETAPMQLCAAVRLTSSRATASRRTGNMPVLLPHSHKGGNEVARSPHKSQTEGQEDQGVPKQLEVVPPALLLFPGPPGLASGSSQGFLCPCVIKFIITPYSSSRVFLKLV